LAEGCDVISHERSIRPQQLQWVIKIIVTLIIPSLSYDGSHKRWIIYDPWSVLGSA